MKSHTICSAVPSNCVQKSGDMLQSFGSRNPTERPSHEPNRGELNRRPSRISERVRISAADFAIGPGLSKNSVMVYNPVVSCLPVVGLSAYKPARVDGVTMEPIVSVAMARGLNQAATATAEPVDEPPGAYLISVSLNNICYFVFSLSDQVSSHCPISSRHTATQSGHHEQTTQASSWSFSCRRIPRTVSEQRPLENQTSTDSHVGLSHNNQAGVNKFLSDSSVP